MEATTFQSTELVKEHHHSTLQKKKYLLPEVHPHSEVETIFIIRIIIIRQLYILHAAPPRPSTS